MAEGAADDGDEGYVHRPSGEPPRKPEATDGAFGWRGWVLVGLLVVSFLVIPWALILLPTAQGDVAGLGLSWRDTYLVVPTVPALVLGAAGVWTALHARRQ
ncbi:MAG: hypothetical protein ABEI57_02585 [Halapricum sp.]